MQTNLTFSGPGTTQDESLVRPLLEHAWDVVGAEFKNRNAPNVLLSSNWTIVWHGAADYARMQGQMCVRTNIGSTTLHILAPSAYPDQKPGAFPAAYPGTWHQKNLIHECTSAFMFHYPAPNPRWDLEHGSPDWFREGLQEVVAIERSPANVRDEYRARYTKRDVSRTVDCEFASVGEKYLDGYLILRFLYEEFGPVRVHRILDRSEATFWETVRVSLGVGRTHLFERWRQWAGRNTRP